MLPLCPFMALLSVFGIKGYLSIASPESVLIFTNSILTVMLFTLIAALNYYLLKRLDKRSAVFAATGGLLASVNLVIGAMLSTYNAIVFDGNIFFIVISLMVLLFSFFAFIAINLNKINNYSSAPENNISTKKFSGRKRSFFVPWVIITIIWIPALLAFYPGIYAYDAIAQLADIQSDILTTHHPVIHTFLLYVTFKAGYYIFGSYQFGMLIYSICQMLILSASTAYACYCLGKWCSRSYAQVFALLFFSLNPIFPILAISATKDVIFSALCLVVICFVVDFSLDAKAIKSNKRLIMFFVFLTITSLFRNTGIVLSVGALIVAVIFFRKYLRRFLFVTAGSIIVYIIISVPLMSALGIESGDVREALCVPIQQLARVYNYSPESFSDEDKKYLLSLIDDESLSNYNPRNADSTKNNFNSEVAKADWGKFIKLWINIGVKCPVMYVESFLMNCQSFWYTDSPNHDLLMGQPYLEVENKIWDGYISIYQESKWIGLRDAYTNITNGTLHERYPLLSMLLSPAAMLWLLIGSIFALLYLKRYYLLSSPFLLLLLWMTMTISPLALVRYALPMFLAAPVLLCLVLTVPKSKCIKDADAK